MTDPIQQLVNMAGGQTQASRLLYTTQPTISRWLAGKNQPPRATLALARILLEGYTTDLEVLRKRCRRLIEIAREYEDHMDLIAAKTAKERSEREGYVPLEDIEDRLDLIAAEESLQEAKEKGTTSWESLKEELDL